MGAVLQRKVKSYLDLVIPHAAQTTTVSSKEFKFKRPAKGLRLKSFQLYSSTGLVAHASNYMVIALKVGATTIATWSTQVGQQGTLTADTLHDMVLAGTAAQRALSSAQILLLTFTANGTVTLPLGKVLVAGEYF